MARKILVVDDSATDRTSLEAILKKAGYAVVSADSGQSGVDKAKAEKPDIVFMDIIMPDMDGYKACRTIKGDDATKSIPIIFCTSKKQDADKMWAQRQGGAGYIVKPATEAEVLAQIKAVS